jgi:hypothetical protein
MSSQPNVQTIRMPLDPAVTHPLFRGIELPDGLQFFDSEGTAATAKLRESMMEQQAKLADLAPFDYLKLRADIDKSTQRGMAIVVDSMTDASLLQDLYSDQITKDGVVLVSEVAEKRKYILKQAALDLEPLGESNMDAFWPIRNTFGNIEVNAISDYSKVPNKMQVSRKDIAKRRASKKAAKASKKRNRNK